MKSYLTSLVAASFVCAPLANAAVTIVQSGTFEDGNTGGSSLNSYTFSIAGVSSANILVVGVYADSSTSSIDSATFGGVTPTSTLTDGRTTSFVFSGLSAATSSDFFIDPTQNPVGIGLIWYEVSNADLSSVTSITGSNAITTTAAGELVIGFAGRNGVANTSVNSSSIFFDGDATIAVTGITGGGMLSADSAIAATPGSQNITWNNATDGRIAYAFQAIPEPSVTAFAGLLSLLVIGRRRRA
jgi:hypothetical protein